MLTPIDLLLASLALALLFAALGFAVGLAVMAHIVTAPYLERRRDAA